MLAQDMVIPPAEVTGPLLSLVGHFLWVCTALLGLAAVLAGVEFAHLYQAAGGVDRAAARVLAVVICAILLGSISGWAAWVI